MSAGPLHVPNPSEKDDFLRGFEGMDDGNGRDHLVAFLTAILTWANENGTTPTQSDNPDSE